jgi:hypothetical protein
MEEQFLHDKWEIESPWREISRVQKKSKRVFLRSDETSVAEVQSEVLMEVRELAEGAPTKPNQWRRSSARRAARGGSFGSENHACCASTSTTN